MKTHPNIHVGQLIAARFYETGLSRHEFARRLGEDHFQYINGLLRKKSVDSALMLKVSVALGFNLFEAVAEKITLPEWSYEAPEPEPQNQPIDPDSQPRKPIGHFGVSFGIGDFIGDIDWIFE